LAINKNCRKCGDVSTNGVNVSPKTSVFLAVNTLCFSGYFIYHQVEHPPIPLSAHTVYLYVDTDIDLSVNCNWVATRWQLYSTHLHTNNTQNNTRMEECGPCPVIASYTPAFVLQLRKKHGKTSVRVAER
jgi:hypothetical protein